MSGIPYPIPEQLKFEIEKKRKEFMLKNKLRINQPKFLERYISPRIIPIIRTSNVDLNIFGKKNVKIKKK